MYVSMYVCMYVCMYTSFPYPNTSQHSSQTSSLTLYLKPAFLQFKDHYPFSPICSSPSVLNLLLNEDESTIRISFRGSFLVIPVHSYPFEYSVLLMRVGSAGEYESFEQVQKLCVASANKFHSCLCASNTSCHLVCRTDYLLYPSHSHYILTVFWLFLLHSR